MPLMPTTPLHAGRLVMCSLSLYAQTFVNTLPYALLIVSLHTLLTMLPHLPFLTLNGQGATALMAAKILLLPLIGGFFVFQGQHLTGHPKLLDSMVAGFKQLIPLVLSIVYLALIPLLCLTITLVGLLLDPAKVAPALRYTLLGAGIVMALGFLANKILTPILVVTDNLDAMGAQARCQALTRGHYFKSLALGLIPVLLVSYLFWVPSLLVLTDTTLTPQAHWVYQGIGAAMLGLLGPWMSLLVCLLINDLKQQHPDGTV